MEIQGIEISVPSEGQIALRWTTMVKVQALQLELGTNSTFTQNCRSILLPEATQSCTVSVSSGAWYIRIGAWVGNELQGKVSWSGVVGPIPIVSTKPPTTQEPSDPRIRKTQELERGVRLYTLNPNPNWMYLEVSQDPAFRSTETTCSYAYDWGKGYVELMGLPEQQTYSIRCSPFSGYPTAAPFDLVKSKTVVTLKPLRTITRQTGLDRTQHLEAKQYAREAKESPFVRFSSYSDYLKMVASRNR